MVGAAPLTTATLWLQVALLLQASMACQTRVATKVLGQLPALLVVVLNTVIVTVPLLSVAEGGSKLQGAPTCTILLVLLEQSMTGGTVSMTLTVWLQVALLLQASIACQTRMASKVSPQWPTVLVSVLKIVIVTWP